MSFLDFFRKKADGEQKKTNVPSGNSSEKASPNTQLNRLMNQMYQQSQQRARASSSSVGKSKPGRRETEADSNAPNNIEAVFDMEGHRLPDIIHNKAYGFEDEDFALSIPRPAPDANKGRKLFEMGMADKRRMSWEGEESGWTQQCHFLFCSYMFGYEPALKEYQKQREKCRARYRQLCGQTEDYMRLAGLRHPARSFAMSSALNSEHFTKVWNILLDSPYGKALEEAWNNLAAAMRLHKIPGPKQNFAFYSHSFPLGLGDDIEKIWAGLYKELGEYVDRLCPIDSDAIDKVSDDYEHNMMVYNVLGAYTMALYAVNAMYDKVFEAVWENPLNLYYNFGEL